MADLADSPSMLACETLGLDEQSRRRVEDHERFSSSAGAIPARRLSTRATDRSSMTVRPSMGDA